ncbi:UDP-N-acetylenolpyruvoylglucosamine reductase MurB [Peptoclostridium acidaminophilum DSM 3953]|uniref:UDP-N-acetylenolpyruvoylglucosamine reductase n=1 Tax=Peptoclostridium acidaminophilum DSM 3953 TaxID=1286171 RepID=W8T4J0_PEPAC|nr:UDP-N-acetylmuramate dehydrogenase [Peptoclostridium acidaminophilum]AHM55750.1 UDP-N-acetylenolpyruvoylglucosamine reductase MurB [Peptoclostridium acidaminophilum DSM 3953]
MDNNMLYEDICKIAGRDCVLIDEPMKNHTSFKIGGPADILVRISSEEALREILKLTGKADAKTHIIGNGSNLLVRDKGIRGVVVKINGGFEAVSISGCSVQAYAGVLLSRLSNIMLENGLSGLEFASGIPGTLGGALAMNAGAYGGEMKDVVRRVHLLDLEGNSTVLDNEHMEFAYRSSIAAKKGLVVVKAELELKRAEGDDIRALMQDYTGRRVAKQPLSAPSAGSTFKRPQGYFAAQLIDEAGLKGFSIGGARVSEKHAGFVISDGTATADDVIKLIEAVKSRVFEKHGVRLEEEVRIIGEE